MTIVQLLNLCAMVAGIAFLVSVVTVIGRVVTARGRASRIDRWYDDTPLCPGIYRIYGDGRPGELTLFVVFLHVIATVILWLGFMLISTYYGAVQIRDMAVSQVWQDIGAFPVTAGALIFTCIVLIFLALHIVSIPQSRYLKTVRVLVPILVPMYVVLGIASAAMMESFILRFTYRACRYFADSAVCAALY